MTSSLTNPGAAAAVVQLDGRWYRLTEPLCVLVANTTEDVPSVIDLADEAAASGNHVAGFVAYEAAPAFGLAAHEGVDGLPFAWFGVFESIKPFDPELLVSSAGALKELDWRPRIGRDAYDGAVARIRSYLAAGETYQVNLTFQLVAPYAGEPFPLFAQLARAQRAGSSFYLDTGRFVICSGSPEIFFERDGDHVLMRPMKGTAPRGRTGAEDTRRAATLKRSPKERAENLMIVDMVRNDLGRIARAGSVQARGLFTVERFPTVLQMTSTVTAETNASLLELYAATFPCASVTGAPKIRTAQLIRELEPEPRGVYTGAVGYLGPGRKARFSVAIRTATVDRGTGIATYGVGSGIVWDSRTESEFEECLAKARVLTSDVRPFSLLETIRWEPGDGFTLLNRHLRRLGASARYFGFPFDRTRVLAALNEATGGPQALRLRLLLAEDGTPQAEATILPEQPAGPVRVGLSREPVDVSTPFVFHKTTRREIYERARASRPECDQVILWTVGGWVTETDIANLAVLRDGSWVTPPVADGLLAGTMRAEFLHAGCLREGGVTLSEVAAAPRIAVFNSVRGWQEAEFVPE